MKWKASSASPVFCVSSTKGLLLAKLLCTSRIRSELLRASPRNSGGRTIVKSRNSESFSPMSTSSGLLRTTLRSACVPHAF
ncbi:hypothetical protein CH063_15104 [Colletotrichum higginsianum]|uniref:Uncharacterized protein n=1 Tax=Colletotrichum higginsianum (strain IMI 349063) TaxID=759273 RepID=H1W1E4_COLHI|nr:hypothetical protein CH063_15104 [Colletotrichum higginsianum]